MQDYTLDYTRLQWAKLRSLALSLKYKNTSIKGAARFSYYTGSIKLAFKLKERNWHRL